MGNQHNNDAVMGKITSVYGVKGWVKVFSYTQPKENLKTYRSWQLESGKQNKQIRVLDCKVHGNGLIAKLDGINDRESARLLSDYLIKVPKADLPDLEPGEYYWHQLEGLEVYSVAGSDKQPSVLFGKVHHMMETGANDVLVVKPTAGSIDDKERLVPYLVDQVVKEVSLESGKICVDWDPDF